MRRFPIFPISAILKFCISVFDHDTKKIKIPDHVYGHSQFEICSPFQKMQILTIWKTHFMGYLFSAIVHWFRKCKYKQTKDTYSHLRSFSFTTKPLVWKNIIINSLKQVRFHKSFSRFLLSLKICNSYSDQDMKKKNTRLYLR